MALTTQHAATRAAAGGLALGIIGGHIVGGLWVVHHARRALRLASQDHSRILELERLVREKGAEIAALRTARPSITLDEYGTLGTIPSLTDRIARHKGTAALTPTAPDPARAYNPIPAIGDAPDARTGS